MHEVRRRGLFDRDRTSGSETPVHFLTALADRLAVPQPQHPVLLIAQQVPQPLAHDVDGLVVLAREQNGLAGKGTGGEQIYHHLGLPRARRAGHDRERCPKCRPRRLFLPRVHGHDRQQGDGIRDLSGPAPSIVEERPQRGAADLVGQLRVPGHFLQLSPEMHGVRAALTREKDRSVDPASIDELARRPRVEHLGRKPPRGESHGLKGRRQPCLERIEVILQIPSDPPKLFRRDVVPLKQQQVGLDPVGITRLHTKPIRLQRLEHYLLHEQRAEVPLTAVAEQKQRVAVVESLCLTGNGNAPAEQPLFAIIPGFEVDAGFPAAEEHLPVVPRGKHRVMKRGELLAQRLPVFGLDAGQVEADQRLDLHLG